MGRKELDITEWLYLSLIRIYTCICQVGQGLSREAKTCLSLCLNSAWYSCLTDIPKSICHKLNSPLSLSQLMATHLPVAWTQFLKSTIIIFFLRPYTSKRLKVLCLPFSYKCRNKSELIRVRRWVLGLWLQRQSLQWAFRTDFLWDWLVWSPCGPGDSQESSPTPQFGDIDSSVLSCLCGPALASVYDCWRGHGFDWVNLCWQSNVNAPICFVLFFF